MEIICKPRRRGKTTDLIKISATNQHIIVCFNRQDTRRIKLMADDMRLNIPTPITYSDFIKQKFRGKCIKGFLIDDFEYLLAQLSGGKPISAVTTNESKRNSK